MGERQEEEEAMNAAAAAAGESDPTQFNVWRQSHQEKKNL
jgi:hypothetical protein